LPLAWALLPSKTTNTYKDMFGSIRSALTNAFGSIGNVKYFQTDFKQAAINAVVDVLPEVTIKDCSFHYRQALMRHIQQEGFKTVYEEDSGVLVGVQLAVDVACLRSSSGMELLEGFLRDFTCVWSAIIISCVSS